MKILIFLFVLIIISSPLFFFIKDLSGYTAYNHFTLYLRQFFIKEKVYCTNCKYAIKGYYKSDTKCGKVTVKNVRNFYEPKNETIYDNPKIKNKYNACTDYEKNDDTGIN